MCLPVKVMAVCWDLFLWCSGLYLTKGMGQSPLPWELATTKYFLASFIWFFFPSWGMRNAEWDMKEVVASMNGEVVGRWEGNLSMLSQPKTSFTCGSQDTICEIQTHISSYTYYLYYTERLGLFKKNLVQLKQWLMHMLGYHIYTRLSKDSRRNYWFMYCPVA